jgi:hypothetical protein
LKARFRLSFKESTGTALGSSRPAKSSGCRRHRQVERHSLARVEPATPSVSTRFATCCSATRCRTMTAVFPSLRNGSHCGSGMSNPRPNAVLKRTSPNSKKQVESLAAQLRNEKEARAEADREIDRNLREQSQALEKRVRALSDQLSELDRDFVDRISRSDQLLREEIKQKVEGVQLLIEKMFSDLSNVKTDRNLLAGLFVEVAKCPVRVGRAVLMTWQ